LSIRNTFVNIKEREVLIEIKDITKVSWSLFSFLGKQLKIYLESGKYYGFGGGEEISNFIKKMIKQT